VKSGANSGRVNSRALLSGVLALLYLGTFLFTPLHLLLETHSHEASSELADALHHSEADHHDDDAHEHHAHPATDHDLALAQPAKFWSLDTLYVATLPLPTDFALRVLESRSLFPTDTGPPEHSPPRSPAQPRSPPLV
jgi:hypothetical protein